MSQSYVLPSPIQDQQDGDLSAESIFANCRRRYSMTPSEKSSVGGSIPLFSPGAKRVVSPCSSISINSVRSSSLKGNHVTSSSSSFRFPKSPPNGQAASASFSSSNLVASSFSNIGPVIAKRGSSLNLNGRARATSQSMSSSGSSSASGYFNRYGSTSTTPSLSLSHSRTASRSDRSDADTIASSTRFSPLGRSLRPFYPSEMDHDVLDEIDERDANYENRVAATQKRSVSSMDIWQDASQDGTPSPDDSFLPNSNDGNFVVDSTKPSSNKKTSISFQQRAARNPDKIAHLLGEDYQHFQVATLMGQVEGRQSTISLSSPTKSGFKNLFSSMRNKSFKKGDEPDFSKSIEEKLFRFGNLSARRSEANLPNMRINPRDTFPAAWRNQKTSLLNKAKDQDVFDDVFIITKKTNGTVTRESGSLSVLDESTREEEGGEGRSMEEQAAIQPRQSRRERLSWLISADDSFLRLDSEGKGESYNSDESNQSSPYSTLKRSSKRALSSESSETESRQLKKSHSIDALYAMLEPWALTGTPSQDRCMSDLDTSLDLITATKPLEIKKRSAISFEKSLPALPEIVAAEEVVPKKQGSKVSTASTIQNGRKQRQSEMDQSIATWCKDFNVYSAETPNNRRQGRNLEHIDVFSHNDDLDQSQMDALPNALNTIMDTLHAEIVYIARVRSKPLSCQVEMIRQRDDYSIHAIRPDAAMHRCALAALQSGLSFQDDEDQVKELLGLESERETYPFNSAVSVGCGLKEVGKGSGGGTEGWVLTVVCNAQSDSRLGSESNKYLMRFTQLLAPLLLAQEYQDDFNRLSRDARPLSSTSLSSPSPSPVFVTPRSSPVRSGEGSSSCGAVLRRGGTLSSSSSHTSAFSRKKLPPLASPPPTSPLPLLPDLPSPLQSRRPLSPSGAIVTPTFQRFTSTLRHVDN